MSTKETILEMLRPMPEDVTWAQIVAEGTARFGPLVESEESPTAEECEAAWGEEINRRLADIDAGRVKLIPAEDVMAKLREKYG